MTDPSLTELALDDLSRVAGGVTHRRTHHHAAHHAAPAPQHSGGIFGFFHDLYQGAVFKIAGNIGGAKLADKMYGGHATAGDKARAQVAMAHFLEGGHKLPQGVPNLFG